MFALYLCFQLTLSLEYKRPIIKETSNEDGYTVQEPIRESSTNIELKKCKFEKISWDSNGGAILIESTKKVNCSLDDCQFIECNGKMGGAIYTYYSGEVDYELNINNCKFTGCQGTKNGGAIFIQSQQPLHHTFTITGCTFTNNIATNGGALYALLRDQLILENCIFNNNLATEKGSSAYLRLGHNNIKNNVEEHDTFKIHGNTFIFNPNATTAANVYIENTIISDENDPPHANVYFGGCTFNLVTSPPLVSKYLHLEVVENEGLFESFTFDACNCVHQEQATVKIASRLNFTNFNFGCESVDKCESNVIPPTPPPTPDTDGYTPTEPIKETTLNINILKCKFTSLGSLEEDGGAILITFNKKVDCIVDDCKFNDCKGENGGAISASYSKATDYKFSVTNSAFVGCEANYSGGAIFITSGQKKHHTFTITGCTFSSNKAKYGGGLYGGLRDQLTLENCKFENNEALYSGASAYLRLGQNNIKNSEEEHDTFKIHGNVFSFVPSETNTVNVYIKNYEISDETDPAHANVYMGGCTFTLGSTKATEEEYLHLKIVEDEKGFESFTFDSCNCVHQGEKTVQITSTKITLYNFNFDCTSIEKCTSEQPLPPPINPSQPDTSGYTPHDAIRETEINIEVKKCLFSKLENQGNGGAILITTKKKVNVSVDDCQFNNCKGTNGGAVYAFYSAAIDYEFTIINSFFTACESTTRGGALYLQSAQPLHHTFNITGCTFSTNKAQYGGGLYAELRDQLTLENCIFNENIATKKGASAYLKLGHENIKNSVEEHDTFNIHKNVFTFTPSSTNTVNVFIENDKITDTTDPAHANVYLGGCTFNIASTADSSNEFLHLEIVENEGNFESFTFDACNCVQQGESTVKITAANIPLYNFNFECQSIDKCSSSAPVPPTTKPPTEPPTADSDGYIPREPIQETTTKIELGKSKFNSIGSLDKDGGAILITYSKKVNCTIDNCKFNECKAKNGGAISASYSKTDDYEFKISKTSFSGCEASQKGGSLCLISAQPLHHSFDINGCTFSSNKAQLGGGLYAELRDKLNIENCIFSNNEASTKGSSMYLKLGHENIKNNVEEHDKFNIHKNVFTFNPSSSNSVNVYIENDLITDETDRAHANVYLGGCTFNLGSSRAAKSDDYLHLEIVENEGGFESFTFDSCNCVQQGENTVKIASTLIANNFHFGCVSIDKCSASPSNPGTSSSSSSSSSESEPSVVDKDAGDESNSNNKSKVGMTIGIAVAAVVVVVIIVVVVVVIVRKKSGTNVQNVGSDDIAQNLNDGNSSNTANFNDPDGAL